jgi:hypothetical protein
MQKSYECELATHIGPESCGAARKSSVEALTGERAGRVLSRVRNFLRDADAVRRSGRHPSGAPISRGVPESRAVRDPVHVRKHLAWEPGDPQSAQGRSCFGTCREV